MKHILILCALTLNLAQAATQDEHKFVYSGQETESFTLKGGIWTLGEGPSTEYCREGGVRYEDDCRNRTRTRKLCQTGSNGQTERCWEESYEEYSCEPKPIYWGSSTPCGTSNAESKWIDMSASVVVKLPKNALQEEVSFTGILEDKSVFKLVPGLLPAGVVATVAVTSKNDPQSKPDALKKNVTFDVKFLKMKDISVLFGKKLSVTKLDHENRRLYLTFDGQVTQHDEVRVSISSKIGYERSRLDIFDFSGKAGGVLKTNRRPEDIILLSKLSKDAKGRTVLEIDVNAAYANLGKNMLRKPIVEVAITKTLDPSVAWFGVTEDMKQVFSAPLK